MKAIAALLALLLLFAFLAGCTQPEEDEGWEQPTPTPTVEEQPDFTEQEEDQELDGFESTLISEEDEIGLGEIV